MKKMNFHIYKSEVFKCSIIKHLAFRHIIVHMQEVLV